MEELTLEDIASMSDDEFEQLSALDNASSSNQSVDETSTTESGDTDSGDDEVIDDDDLDPSNELDPESEDRQSDDEGSQIDDDGNSDDDDDDPEDEDDDESPTDEEGDNQDDDDEPQTNDNDEDSIRDEILSEVLQPLVVKGKKKPVKNLEHMRALAQQGLLASQTLQQVKPYRRIVNTLKEYGLVGNTDGEEKLKILLDAAKGEPDAIIQLARMNDIDLTDIVLNDDDEDFEYRPKAVIPNDNQIEVQETLESLRDSDKYSTLVQAINDMDSKSKQEFYKEPSMIELLHADIENGIYDEIVEEIEYKKAVGTLSGSVPFIDSYREVATELAAQKIPQQKKSAQNTKKVRVKKKKPYNPNKMSNPKHKKGSDKNQALTPEELLSLSDEEFEKLSKMFE